MNKIFGIGIDVTKHARMQQIINASYAERFFCKVLHPSEIQEIQQKNSIKQKTEYLASRWSFKEAMVKASGDKSLLYPKMFLKKDQNGKPSVQYIDENELILSKLGIKFVHVSISHEDDFSTSIIIMEH